LNPNCTVDIEIEFSSVPFSWKSKVFYGSYENKGTPQFGACLLDLLYKIMAIDSD
jgi:hypothetical protein